MARRNKEEERQKLTALIKEWNANRLDLFALSQPNEVNSMAKIYILFKSFWVALKGLIVGIKGD